MPRAEANGATNFAEQVESARAEVADPAMSALGVGADPVVALSQGLSQGAGWYLVLALSGMAAATETVTFAFALMGADIGAALGISATAVAAIIAQQSTAAAFAALGNSMVIQRGPRRAAIALQAAVVLVVALLVGGFASDHWAVLFAIGASGPAVAAVYVAHRPMLVDAYPPDVRFRSLSIHRAGGALGAVFAGVLVAGLYAAGLTWRAVLMVAVPFFIAVLAVGARVRDPGRGRFDVDRVRAIVRTREQDDERPCGDASGLGFIELYRRVWQVPTIRRLMLAWAVLGAVLNPLVTYLFYLLRGRFQLGTEGCGLFFAVIWLPAIAVLVWLAPRGERLFRGDPGALTSVGAVVLLVMAMAMVLGAAVPNLALDGMAFAVVLCGAALLVPILTLPMLAVVRPEGRGHVSALACAFYAVVGAEAGSFVLGGFESSGGPALGIGVLAVPALIAASVLHRAGRTVRADMEEVVNELVESEESAIRAARRQHVPLLSCRHVDFSYGPLQVLFDVGFSLDEGEMVALLGTNGAGKSTLLRVIAGLGLPSRGTVHYLGQDITFLTASRRVPMGIVQVPGGRAVFGDMTVADNLRVFGFTHGRQRRQIDAGVDATFATFPRLAERRNQLASTLSGGEQQMLGLGRALIIRPKVLLIDELSLGLAPKVVGELLDTVSDINHAGAAVVLVEQSVNLALSVVDHAYFMERGSVRFDGPAKELLRRPDLLRSIFLEGATRGLG
jgi:ABC-type branched-subunit amino acid transport system ATPase component